MVGQRRKKLLVGLATGYVRSTRGAFEEPTLRGYLLWMRITKASLVQKALFFFPANPITLISRVTNVRRDNRGVIN